MRPWRRLNVGRIAAGPRAAALRTALFSIAAASYLAGCTPILISPQPKPLDHLLRRVATSPDSVTLEIFHARIPNDKDQKAEALWDQIDEQCFDAGLRRRLLANGLRAGVVGSTLPDGLAELLSLKSEMPTETEARQINAGSAVPRVSRRVLQLNARDQTTIQTSDVRDEAQILISDNGKLRGGVYRQVQGVYTLRAQAAQGQRVRVRVTPELQHGEMRNRYTGESDQGIFMLTQSRQREVFDRLELEATLAPGELLVLGSLPDAQSTLGGIFHTAVGNGDHERKLILIRALETPPSEILAEK